jgi:hypothetical protein
MLIRESRAAAAFDAEFRKVDGELSTLERRIADGAALPLAATVEQSITLVSRLLVACIAMEGHKRIPDASADILDVFKALVKGEPSWTAIRDNCRELVYYRNCINLQRHDALPVAAEKMAAHRAAHLPLCQNAHVAR